MPPLNQPPTPQAPVTPPQNAAPAYMPAGGPKPVTTPEPAHKKGLSTQNSLLISEIRDGMVIMRDGSMRAVVLCQSINFDLMSPGERESVEFAYQGFINSLYFPVQIFIRSKRVNLDGYLEKLQQIHANQDNILLGLLMEDYIAYVRYLTETANIMDKQFYVVVPYYPQMSAQEGITSSAKKVGGLFKKGEKQTIVINEADFSKYKTELTQQVQVILAGLAQMGVQAIPLNTQELIELYYSVYNPETASNQKLASISELEAPIVTKGSGPAPARGA